MNRYLAAFLLCLLCAQAAALEEPKFETIAEIDGVEYRQYESYLVAETVVAQGDSRDDAANVGFRRLFGYISGDNEVQAKIAMTAITLMVMGVKQTVHSFQMNALHRLM